MAPEPRLHDKDGRHYPELLRLPDEAVPAVIVRGLSWQQADGPAATLVRPAEQDLFR